MMTCRICGKRFVVTWPQHWVYRRKDVFLCSEDCMIVYDVQTTRAANGFGPKKKGAEENMAGKLTQKQRDEAVEIAIQGGSPIEYLKKCGIANPYASWDWIKKSLEAKNPEKYMKLTGGKEKKTPEKPAEVVKVEKVPEIADMPEARIRPVVEVPEKMIQPLQPLVIQGGVDYQMKVEEMEAEAAELLKIIGVETLLGSYVRGNVSRNVIYFRRAIDKGDVIEVAMVEDDWRQLARELPKVLKTLGVDA